MSSLSYQNCYDILSLANDASWEEASVRYRKLVQQWHPDRYQGKDNEIAELRFIEITKAFNKLRDYYQANDALPFSSVKSEISSEELATRSSGLRRKNSRHSVTDNPNKRVSPFMWLIGAVFLIGAALFIAFMIQLEKKSSAKNREAARVQRVLENEQNQKRDIQGTPGATGVQSEGDSE